jgi:hypothetical protein
MTAHMGIVNTKMSATNPISLIADDHEWPLFGDSPLIHPTIPTLRAIRVALPSGAGRHQR